jgi:hypothetical protein
MGMRPFDNTPETSDEVLLREADLGRKINYLLLAWMDPVLSREGVIRRHQEVVMTLAPTLEM